MNQILTRIVGLFALIIILVASSCTSHKTSSAQSYTSQLVAEAIEDSIKLSSGDIQRYHVKSQYIDSRYVDVWLPDNYNEKKKYRVLYMHDGQSLFDSSRSWNASEWEVDENMSRLIKEAKIKETIVVAIWHNGHKRHLEYFPQKAIDYIAAPQHDILLGLMPEEPQADKYLKFLVEELKPFIDKKYSVKTDRANTFVAGSSMGGLISMYAICEYPGIFGGAGCMSTHWIGTFDNNKEIPAAFNKYMKENLPSSKTHKIYFDYGTVGLDSNYPGHQKMIDQTMIGAGYSESNWITKEFPGEDHNEKYWSKRLHYPLEFLLK